MIRGIHYFSTELKTKIDVIPRGCFKLIKEITWDDLINTLKLLLRTNNAERLDSEVYQALSI